MEVVIYSKPQCPFCVQAKALAEREGHDLTYKMLDEDFDRETLMETFPGAVAGALGLDGPGPF